MNRQRAWQLLMGAVILVILAALAFQTCVITPPWTNDRQAATVQVTDSDGTPLTTVQTEVADTHCQRYEGLSGTDTLPNGSGMLFVHGSERDLTYVMRGMNYGLDIIFIDADGQITAVRSAPPPGPNENGNDIRRSGRGKFVLEVPRGYAAANDIDVGDRVEIQYDD